MTLAGLALLIVLATTSVWAWLAYRVRVPTNRTPFVAMWAGGATLGVVALVQGAGGAAAWVAAGLGGTLVFLASTGGQNAAVPDSVCVGSRLPEFTAPDENGAPFDIRSLSGNPILLKFFRGHW